MKVKYTAEIVDDSGKVIGIRTSEAGGIPSLDSFDLSTREGFLRDFDVMEKAILKARSQLDLKHAFFAVLLRISSATSSSS